MTQAAKGTIMNPKFTTILHLGIVVRDVEQSVEFYEKELGIGPWRIDDADKFFHDLKVNDGYGLPIRSAICNSIGYEIELIQPLGPGLYQDWLDEHGPGMHHVVLKTDESYDDIVALGEKYSDHSHYMDAFWPNGRPLVSYVDMRDTMGLILEVSPMPQGFEPPEGVPGEFPPGPPTLNDN